VYAGRASAGGAGVFPAQAEGDDHDGRDRADDDQGAA
jgi:hypothetical protein